jgi:nucleoside diphosphate kinase
MKILLIVEPKPKRYEGLSSSIQSFIHGNKLKMCLNITAQPDRKFWEEFSQVHAKTPCTEEKIKYLTSAPSTFSILEGGYDIVKKVVQYAANIRTRYGKTKESTMSVILVSDSNESAQKEIDFIIESISRGRL